MAVQKKKEDTTKRVPFFKDRRFKFSIGIILVCFAVFLFIVVVSYFFTWDSDQSLSYNPNPSVEVEVSNNGGHFGYKVAAWLAGKWFGVAALFIPVFLAVWGLWLLKVKTLPLRKTFFVCLFGAIVVSITLAFITSAKSLNSLLGNGLGGAHGYYISRWLVSNIGSVGTALALIIALILLAIYINRSTVDKLEQLGVKLLSFFKRKPDAKPIPQLQAEADKEDEREDEYAEDDVRVSYETTFEVSVGNIEDQEPNEPLGKTDEVELDIETREKEKEVTDLVQEFGLYDPTLDLKGYQRPPLELLEDYKNKDIAVTKQELERNKEKIIKTLNDYKIGIDKIKATIGPSVTLYEIVPKAGVRIASIKRLEDDIALSLSALGIRIIAPIPGKGTVGIEVPNEKPETVSMLSLLRSAKFQEARYELPVALGKTIANETYVFDLTKMPHLLVAGATGQGKSVGLNAILTSLLYKKHPAELKLVMVDPKKVELTLYNKIEKHFLAKLPDSDEAIITDTQKVVYTLKSLCMEMDSRYDLLKLAQVRNVKEYNEKFVNRKLSPNNGHRFLPYIVLVIDEFADLIMTAGREIEEPIARLAQMARAIGIHLIIATQRPTTNIITGLIKANFPARIAFRVISMIDSRTILDSPGANQLVGRGDMLISTGSELTRVQCAFVDLPEVERITDFVGNQRGYISAFELPEYKGEDADGFGSKADMTKLDDKFEEAARLVVQQQQGSTSLIQRRMELGYNRAGRIMDQLEAAGIVGPSEGSKARQVLVSDFETLDNILDSLRGRW